MGGWRAKKARVALAATSVVGLLLGRAAPAAADMFEASERAMKAIDAKWPDHGEAEYTRLYGEVIGPGAQVQAQGFGALLPKLERAARCRRAYQNIHGALAGIDEALPGLASKSYGDASAAGCARRRRAGTSVSRARAAGRRPPRFPIASAG